MIKILLAIEDDWLRKVIHSAIEEAHDMNILAETNDASNVLNMIELLRPHVVLIETNSIVPHHLEILEQIQRIFPKCKTILFTAATEDVLIMEAFMKGLAGHIEKQAEISISKVLNIIRTVRKGGTILPPHLMSVVVDGLFNEYKSEISLSHPMPDIE